MYHLHFKAALTRSRHLVMWSYSYDTLCDEKLDCQAQGSYIYLINSMEDTN